MIRSTSKPDTVYRCHFSGFTSKGLYSSRLTRTFTFVCIGADECSCVLDTMVWYCGLANYVISVDGSDNICTFHQSLQQLWRRIGHHIFGLQRVEWSSRMSMSANHFRSLLEVANFDLLLMNWTILVVFLKHVEIGEFF
ncbi:hypothetical protein Tco_1021376 [Tanacetum coccineum]